MYIGENCTEGKLVTTIDDDINDDDGNDDVVDKDEKREYQWVTMMTTMMEQKALGIDLDENLYSLA